MSILQTLAERQRRQRSVDQQRLTSAVVISGGFGRYTVSDGASTLEVETIVREQIKPGTRVWITRGRGVNVLVGIHGQDVTASENE